MIVTRCLLLNLCCTTKSDKPCAYYIMVVSVRNSSVTMGLKVIVRPTSTVKPMHGDSVWLKIFGQWLQQISYDFKVRDALVLPSVNHSMYILSKVNDFILFTTYSSYAIFLVVHSSHVLKHESIFHFSVLEQWKICICDLNPWKMLKLVFKYQTR